jgi:hypothetical protein
MGYHAAALKGGYKAWVANFPVEGKPTPEAEKT